PRLRDRRSQRRWRPRKRAARPAALGEHGPVQHGGGGPPPRLLPLVRVWLEDALRWVRGQGRVHPLSPDPGDEQRDVVRLRWNAAACRQPPDRPRLPATLWTRDQPPTRVASDPSLRFGRAGWCGGVLSDRDQGPRRAAPGGATAGSARGRS